MELHRPIPRRELIFKRFPEYVAEKGVKYGVLGLGLWGGVNLLTGNFLGQKRSFGNVPVASVTQDKKRYAELAVKSHEAMFRKYQTVFAPGYKGELDSIKPADLWPYSTVLQAHLDMLVFPDKRAEYTKKFQVDLDSLKSFWKPGNPLAYESSAYASIITDRYYDDNAWIALFFLRLYELDRKEVDLRNAEVLFKFAQRGWGTVRSDKFEGGVPWVEQVDGEPNKDRNAISNLPNAHAGLRILLAGPTTLDPDQVLADSMKMYQWTENALDDYQNRLLNDKVDENGNIDTSKWTYIEGERVKVEVLLHQVEKRKARKEEWLEKAAWHASNSLDHFNQGAIYSNLQFEAVYFRDLLSVSRFLGRRLQTKIQDQLSSYVDYLLKHHVDRTSGRISFGDRELLIHQTSLTSLSVMISLQEEMYDYLG